MILASKWARMRFFTRPHWRRVGGVAWRFFPTSIFFNVFQANIQALSRIGHSWSLWLVRSRTHKWENNQWEGGEKRGRVERFTEDDYPLQGNPWATAILTPVILFFSNIKGRRSWVQCLTFDLSDIICGRKRWYRCLVRELERWNMSREFISKRYMSQRSYHLGPGIFAQQAAGETEGRGPLGHHHHHHLVR